MPVAQDNSAAIQVKLNNLNLRKVVNILHYCFQAGEEDVTYEGQFTTPIEILENFPGWGEKSADAVAIRFFGGPPNNYGFYDGTFCTLLADKVLSAVAHGQHNVIKKFLKA